MPSFLRTWRVQIGDLVTDSRGVGDIRAGARTSAGNGLRVAFKVTKTLGKEPNTCDLSVWNLSEASRGRLRAARLPCIVEAGYEGETQGRGVIFSGETRVVDHLTDGPDWVTRVQCGDGERAYQDATLNKSFKNVDFLQIVRETATALVPNIGNLAEAVQQAVAGGKQLPNTKRGYVAQGKVRDTLADQLKSLGLSYSVQDGRLLVVQLGQPSTDARAVLLSPSTGLVGSPDHTPPDKPGEPTTLKVKALLNPTIVPAGIIRVESAGVNGDFVVQKLTHSGDSHGAEWTTDIEAWART